MKIVCSALALTLLALGLGFLAAPADAYPAGVQATAQINSTVFPPGGTVIVTVQNTTPGSLTMQIFSAPVTIGTGTVGPNGQGSVSGTSPPATAAPTRSRSPAPAARSSRSRSP